ncbi:hypothetical protein P154DRAFT_300613 [Amniculicola lignicola CBS 123094]|uniref:Uncharacterized protein n=1 Tax=Amniculicola lignicola CBS 123094 TaxID=1392246 RepID=A0A6A5W820_9PLEO|nr:hypothetical protein P154DRAFT_300613 [Amniculicola lignicola CBS 123094]
MNMDIDHHTGFPRVWNSFRGHATYRRRSLGRKHAETKRPATKNKMSPASRSSPCHGSRINGPRDDGFTSGMRALGQHRSRQLSKGVCRAGDDLSGRPWLWRRKLEAV